MLVISKCVADEINVDPRLEKWTQEHFSNLVYDENRDPFVWPKYAEIINYVQNCGAYQTGSVNGKCQYFCGRLLTISLTLIS